MTRVLFVCHGNICRSTMAEFVFKDMLKKSGIENIHIESAATSREEIGNDTYPPVKELLYKEGIPFEKRKARQITVDDYNKFDYIIGMDDANIRNIKRICGEDFAGKVSKLLNFAGSNADISDPWYTRDFNATYVDVVKGCKGLLQDIENKRIINTT